MKLRRLHLMELVLGPMLLALLVGCGSLPPQSLGASGGSGSAVSAPATFTATDFTSGKDVSLAQLRGRPALLVSWATWCGECHVELPQVQAMWSNQKGNGLQVVAVNVNADGSTYKIGKDAFEMKLTMPVWLDPDDNFAGEFDAVGVPTTVLLDSAGVVMKKWSGAIDVTDPAVASIIASAR